MRPLRLFLLFLGMTVLAFLLHLVIFQWDFSLQSVSDSLFVTGVIFFLPAIIAWSSAYEIFQGIGYVFRVTLSPAFRREYPRFRDFKADRKAEIKTSLFKEMALASFLLLLASGILAWVVLS